MTAVGRTAVAPTRGLLKRNLDRIDGADRVAGVDLARGLAVVGMLAAHLLIVPILVLGDPSTWAGVVDGRSSILFATLAGVSLGLATGGRRRRTGDALRVARLRLLVRAAVLWILGIALILTGVPVYVILPAYALLFVLAVPFLRLGAPVLLVVAAASAVILPFVQPILDEQPVWSGRAGETLSFAIGWHYPFTVWIAFVLAGLGIARAGVDRLRVQLWMVGAGAALAAVGYGADAALGTPADAYAAQVWTAAPHSSGVLEVIGSGGFAIAVTGLCLLLCRTGLRVVVLPLRATGAMPLTAYTAQLVVWAVWAASVLGDAGDLSGFRALDPFPVITLATIAGCTAWALLIGRGPLEWVLDRVARLVPSRG
ncbi:heparan-alpha-glucosaminide N-acetyltransferase domain-containing protein [Microbacterium sp. 1P10UB]|uniref:heparan-alpha-glucosaminide N-acetyltransferase domain-containing protein n=1 Tax=unclassified Microbacterium TaxID=2609290 RepID=UPI0039A0FCFE